MISTPHEGERAPGVQLAGVPQTRGINHPPKQAISLHSTPDTDRAMLRLMGVLRQIAENNINELEKAA